MSIPRGDEHKTYYTQVHFHGVDSSLRLTVFPKGVFTGVRRFSGMQDIVIGSPSVDDRHIIDGGSDDQVREFLNAEAQNCINRPYNLMGKQQYSCLVVSRLHTY